MIDYKAKLIALLGKLDTEIEILVQVDVKNQIPGKAIRLYNAKGDSAGFGEMNLGTVDSEGDLFSEGSSHQSYKAKINLLKILKGGEHGKI